MTPRRTLLLLITLFSLAACVEERVVRDDFSLLRELANNEGGKSQPEVSTQSADPAGYAILLRSFEGSKRYREARSLAHRLTSELLIPDVWVHEEGKTVMVFRGRYPEPTVDAAVRDLRQTRMIQINNERPFVGAGLVSLDVAQGTGVGGKFDLRRHRGMYSLQIGFYDREFGAEFRQAAEKAAKVLRDEGHEAYYYHGRSLSLITIGLFTDKDLVYVDKVANYGPRVKELQAKFPYNLANGLTIVNTVNGTKITQPSFLVRVE